MPGKITLPRKEGGVKTPSERSETALPHARAFQAQDLALAAQELATRVRG